MDKATRDAFLDGMPVYVSIEYVDVDSAALPVSTGAGVSRPGIAAS